MTHAALTPLLGPEFDSFLFAPIDDDGSSLSVVSALARLDVDPWGEAAGLARMPKEQALKRLTSLIASLPKGSDLPREATAARLIALLPRAGSAMPPALAPVTAIAPRLSPLSIALGLLVLLLVGYFIFTTRASSAPTIAAYAAATTDGFPTATFMALSWSNLDQRCGVASNNSSDLPRGEAGAFTGGRPSPRSEEASMPVGRCADCSRLTIWREHTAAAEPA